MTASLVIQALSRAVEDDPEVQHHLRSINARVLHLLTAGAVAAPNTTPQTLHQTTLQAAAPQQQPLGRNDPTLPTPSHPPPPPDPAPLALCRPAHRLSDAPRPHPTAPANAFEAGWTDVRRGGTSRRPEEQPEDSAGTYNANLFHLLPDDVEPPHSSSFAAAAASPARAPAPAPVPQPSPTRPAPAPAAVGRQTAILSTAALDADDKLCTLPPFFLLTHARKMVKAAGGGTARRWSG
ncbi:hypothetical protein JCM6882_008064 [Rhodosporidiobolus microsporus]